MVGVGHIWGAAGLLGVVMVGCVILLWHLVKRRLDQEDRDRSRILDEEAAHRKLFREFLAGKDSAVHQHELDARLKLFEADLKLANENALQTKIENLRAELQRDHASHEAVMRVAAETRLEMVKQAMKALAEFDGLVRQAESLHQGNLEQQRRKGGVTFMPNVTPEQVVARARTSAGLLPPSLVDSGVALLEILASCAAEAGGKIHKLKEEGRADSIQGRLQTAASMEEFRRAHVNFHAEVLDWRWREWTELTGEKRAQESTSAVVIQQKEREERVASKFREALEAMRESQSAVAKDVARLEARFAKERGGAGES